jgi:plastocyanin
MLWKGLVPVLWITVMLLTAVGITVGAKDFTAAIGDDGVQRVEVLGGSYFFDPDRIIVKAGSPVELVLRKQAGVTPHDFVLKAPEAGIDVVRELSTEPVVVRFTPTKTGKYEFYCAKKFLFLSSHREKGMQGILEVTE